GREQRGDPGVTDQRGPPRCGGCHRTVKESLSIRCGLSKAEFSRLRFEHGSGEWAVNFLDKSLRQLRKYRPPVFGHAIRELYLEHLSNTSNFTRTVFAYRCGKVARYTIDRPIARNLSRRWRRTVSRSRPASSPSAAAIASPVAATAAAGSRWAPPTGSGMIASITPKRTRSSAVIFMLVAASCALEVSRQRIEAAPSGEITL